MTAFLRPELLSAASYHLEAIAPELIKLDANEFPYDLPPDFKQKLSAIVSGDLASNLYPDGIYQELSRRSLIMLAVLQTTFLWATAPMN